MIGSFWNLCSACPSMPVDKLHSEYRSTYRWHEYTGPRQEIVRKAPQAKSVVNTNNNNNNNNTTIVLEKGEQHQRQIIEPHQQQNQNPKFDHDQDQFHTDSGINNNVMKMEPAIPRRKKYPDLAYRHHEFLASSNHMDNNNDNQQSNLMMKNTNARARSEERASNWRPSRRSKSEGRHCGGGNNGARRNLINADNMTTCILGGNGGGRRSVESARIIESDLRRDSDLDLENIMMESGLFRKAISKLSTEYRLQFAWPPGHVFKRENSLSGGNDTPRKSQSMGALKSSANNVMVHKNVTEDTKDGAELEPLVANNVGKNKENRAQIYKDEFNGQSEYQKNFRPYSQYDYTERRFTTKRELTNHNNNANNTSNTGFLNNDEAIINKTIPITDDGSLPEQEKDTWYNEVVELRKKAGEYKTRGWRCELGPVNKSNDTQMMDCWDQVSRRSSLSALSLASSMTTANNNNNNNNTIINKATTKEEKEKANTSKSALSPNNNNTTVTNKIKLIDTNRYAARELVRHHLERTTGGSEFDGLILSPTREKLEPTIPRKDDDFRGSQLGSPKKTSPHGNNKSIAAMKKHYASKSTINSNIKVRSQSAGPIDTNCTTASGGIINMHSNEANKSPKRQSRSAVMITKENANNIKQQRSISISANMVNNRNKPSRPSTLNTTAPSSKSKFKQDGNQQLVKVLLQNQSKELDRKNNTNNSILQNGVVLRKVDDENEDQKEMNSDDHPEDGIVSFTNDDQIVDMQKDEKLDEEEEDEEEEREDHLDGVVGEDVSTGTTANIAFNHVEDMMIMHQLNEPIVKSPPEPTRVKSPEQILMRSPDPVNWTVPLDTGKVFTVTQNVREDQIGTRPHSENKQWSTSDFPSLTTNTNQSSNTMHLTESTNEKGGINLAVEA